MYWQLGLQHVILGRDYSSCITMTLFIFDLGNSIMNANSNKGDITFFFVFFLFSFFCLILQLHLLLSVTLCLSREFKHSVGLFHAWSHHYLLTFLKSADFLGVR